MSRATCFVSCILLGLVGCGRWSPPAGLPIPTDSSDQVEIKSASSTGGLTEPQRTQLRSDLEDLLLQVRERQLNVTDHAAWQVLHGVLAFGREFPLTIRDGQAAEPALDYLLRGGALKGWNWQPGTNLPNGRLGLRAVVEAGTKTGQGHVDQWFAYMSQAGLSPEQEIHVGGQTFLLADVIGQSQLDVPRNPDHEWSWTVAGLVSYLPTRSSWKAGDGQTWTLEQLVDSEVQQDLATSACGGTHRMVSLTMALNQHIAQGGELTGAWGKVDQKVRECLAKAKESQQASGAFSSNYFERPGSSADLAQILGSTGHTFEFVAMALPQSEIEAEWVTRAARYLMSLLRSTMDRQLECGALYHATHGLVIYRDRLVGTGPLTQPATPPPTATAGPVPR